MLLEGEKMRHYMCPAEATEKLLTLSSGIATPTAKLKVRREPKNGVSGVPADRDGKTSSLLDDVGHVITSLTAAPSGTIPNLIHRN